MNCQSSLEGMHVHGHDDGFTTHHAMEAGSPHEHATVAKLKADVGKVMDSDGDYDGDGAAGAPPVAIVARGCSVGVNSTSASSPAAVRAVSQSENISPCLSSEPLGLGEGGEQNAPLGRGVVASGRTSCPDTVGDFRNFSSARQA